MDFPLTAFGCEREKDTKGVSGCVKKISRGVRRGEEAKVVSRALVLERIRSQLTTGTVEPADRKEVARDQATRRTTTRQGGELWGVGVCVHKRTWEDDKGRGNLAFVRRSLRTRRATTKTMAKAKESLVRGTTKPFDPEKEVGDETAQVVYAGRLFACPTRRGGDVGLEGRVFLFWINLFFFFRFSLEGWGH